MNYPLLRQEIQQSDETETETTYTDSSESLPYIGQYFILLNALHSQTMEKSQFTHLVKETYSPKKYPTISPTLLEEVITELIFIFDVCRGKIPSFTTNPDHWVVRKVEELESESVSRNTIKHQIGRIASKNIREWLKEPEQNDMITKYSPENLPFVQRLELWKERDNTRQQQK